MYQDNFFNELIIDNFAGGGGASVGIELATGRPVDIAVNHDADAIAMHTVNHPYTTHYQEDVFVIDPEKVTGGRPVGIAWFSPDCKHFSRAKGNKPVEHKIRGLSWVILQWAMSSVAPRCIFMENVEEIQTWGPLIEDEDGKCRPDPEHAGETFKAFVGMLSDGVSPDCPALAEACEFLNIERGSEDEQRLIDGLGYKVEYRVLRACDYGAPTIRKRFYLVARNDDKEIVFPKPTHGKGKGLKPYRTAAECIDWTIPCPSIFERKKPLVKNTLRRVARGLDKFVIKKPNPYILEMNFDNPLQDVDKPMSTQTAVNKHFVVTPSLAVYSHKSGLGVHEVENPLNTVTGKACFALTAPSLLQYHSEQSKGEVRGQKINEPIMTVDSSPRYATIAANIVHYYGGADHASRSDAPIPTVTTLPRHYLCASNLCVLRKNMDGKSLDDPMPTLTTSAGHFSKVRTYLLPIDGTQDLLHWYEVRKLLNEYADYEIGENEILIIEIDGTPYFIGDIGMRMLKAEELKLAQGFPEDYVIDIESQIGKKYSEAKQIARLGNAVCPPVATALIRANCADMCYKKILITVADLNKAIARSVG